MTIAACIIYALIVAAVIAWLLYELRADKKGSIKPTVPQSKRLPPRDDL